MHGIQQRLKELCEIRKGIDPTSKIPTNESCLDNQKSLCNYGPCVQAYAEVGYILTEEACSDFFDALVASSNNIQMTKADALAASTAAATILALSKKTTRTIGNTAALFGLSTALLDNWQKYYLMTPYPVQTRNLVLGALTTYRQAYPPQDAVDILDADERVSAYARLCSYSGIANLAEQALAKSVTIPADAPAETIFSDADRSGVLSTIQMTLKLPSSAFKDEDYVILEVASEETVPSQKYIDALSPDVKAKLPYTTATEKQKTTAAIKQIGGVLHPLLLSNTKFKSAVDAFKQQNPNPKDPVVVPKTTRRAPPTILVNPSASTDRPRQ